MESVAFTLQIVVVVMITTTAFRSVRFELLGATAATLLASFEMASLSQYGSFVGASATVSVCCLLIGLPTVLILAICKDLYGPTRKIRIQTLGCGQHGAVPLRCQSLDSPSMLSKNIISACAFTPFLAPLIGTVIFFVLQSHQIWVQPFYNAFAAGTLFAPAAALIIALFASCFRLVRIRWRWQTSIFLLPVLAFSNSLLY